MASLSITADIQADSSLLSDLSLETDNTASIVSDSSFSADFGLDTAALVSDSQVDSDLSVNNTRLVSDSSFTADATVAFGFSLAIVGSAGISPGVQVSLNAVGISPLRVHLIFPTAMLNDSNLSLASNYTVTDEYGNVLPVTSAVPDDPACTALTLTLSSPMRTTQSYTVDVSTSVQVATGGPLDNPTTSFDWVDEPNNSPISIPMSEFTGEVSGDLFGTPAGMVFFSPALNESASNSVIQLEEVDVCTYAFDSYTFPKAIDPLPLFTFGRGRPDGSVLGPGSGTVLWAPFPRNSEVLFEFGFSPSVTNDLVPTADDSAVTVTMNETWDSSYVSLLNNTAWLLYAAQHPLPATPPLFITAKNGSPIPSGGETTLVIKFGLTGRSTLTASLTYVIALRAVIVADSAFLTLPAQADLRGQANLYARLSADHALSASLLGDSALFASET